jgi:all-trans-nonaprenyl-diphosphate synthase
MSSTVTKSLKEIIAPVNADLEKLDHRILNEISPASRALSSIIQEIFKAGGKRVRPALSFLVFRALTVGKEVSADITEKIFLAAEISELIHTASLVHDDIIDNSLIRRGRETANSKWDNAVTVISGDFMFARAAVNLGKVGINEITCIYAKVLEDLCDGEIRQVEKKYSTETDWDYYYSKTYKKNCFAF